MELIGVVFSEDRYYDSYNDDDDDFDDYEYEPKIYDFINKLDLSIKVGDKVDCLLSNKTIKTGIVEHVYEISEKDLKKGIKYSHILKVYEKKSLLKKLFGRK